MANVFSKWMRRTPPITIPRRTTKPSLIRSRLDALDNPWYSPYQTFLNAPNQFANLQTNLPRYRDLSRELSQRDGIASKYFDLVGILVIGDEGFRMIPNVKSVDGTLDKETNDKITAAWLKWCETPSYNGRQAFVDLQDQAITSVAIDGEALFRIVRGGKDVNEFGIALQPLDASSLDVKHNQVLENGNRVILGIEFDKRNRAVAYHITTTEANKLVRLRLPATNVVHLYRDPSGVLPRGIPWIAPVIKTLLRLHDWSEAHLIASQLAAAMPLVIKDDPTAAVDTGNVGVTNEDTTEEPINLDLDHVNIVRLPSDKTLTALQAQFPQSQFDAVRKSYWMECATGLVVSYSTLTSDYSNESYSSAEMGNSVEREHWKSVQFWMARNFLTPIFKAWLEQSILSGQLKLDINRLDDYKVKWIGTGFQSVDIYKDSKAYNELLGQGLITRTQIVAENGGNLEDNVRQLAEEQRMFADAGLSLPELQAKADLVTTIKDAIQEKE